MTMCIPMNQGTNVDIETAQAITSQSHQQSPTMSPQQRAPNRFTNTSAIAPESHARTPHQSDPIAWPLQSSKGSNGVASCLEELLATGFARCLRNIATVQPALVAGLGRFGARVSSSACC